MPYIPIKKRLRLVAWGAPETAGELNFAITDLTNAFRALNGDSYDTFNAIIGTLECAKMEFYWRIVRPYEDEKQKEHGDVYLPPLTTKEPK